LKRARRKDRPSLHNTIISGVLKQTSTLTLLNFLSFPLEDLTRLKHFNITSPLKEEQKEDLVHSLLPLESKDFTSIWTLVPGEYGRGFRGGDGEDRGRISLIFLSSMNHDAQRKYIAPGSLDHPASSILKARNLIAKMSLGAVKRGVAITIVVWSYKIGKVIEFRPAQFTQEAETGGEKELMEDKGKLKVWKCSFFSFSILLAAQRAEIICFLLFLFFNRH
jgi:hypothetical protein